MTLLKSSVCLAALERRALHLPSPLLPGLRFSLAFHQWLKEQQDDIEHKEHDDQQFQD
jgi:hypothetical protein